MILVYSMGSCPDCIRVLEQIKGNPEFKVLEIGSHARILKQFLQLRDCSPVLEQARENGSIGIPCFILEDGSVTLNPKDVGLQ